jgi:hypothetical protein
LSDPLFISLSLIWFTTLIWIINRPTVGLVLVQAVVLFVAFTVRYNALFYPFISALALLLSRQRIWIKISGITVSILLVALFIAFTTSRYKDLTGTAQFSPFSGWQLANNAMYGYRYVDSFHLRTPPPKLRELDHMVRTYFDTTRDLRRNPQERVEASTVYMWDHRSPLQHFMNLKFRDSSKAKMMKKWASVAPLYASYGNWLITTYPEAFAEHYLWPNTKNYYTPPVEFLDSYNMGADSVYPIAQSWFRYPGKYVKTLAKSFKVDILNYYPILIGVLNAVFVVAFIFYLMLRRQDKASIQYKILLLVLGLWMANFSFSVFASAIALRFQVFATWIVLALTLLLLEHIGRAAFEK